MGVNIKTISIMNNSEYLAQLNEKQAINKWIFFTFNYPYDFIEKCWADQPLMAKHLRSKFDGDMNRFYCELDDTNNNQLLDWVLENYKDEPKYFG